VVLKNKIVIIEKQFEPTIFTYKTPLTESRFDLFTEGEILEQIISMLLSKRTFTEFPQLLWTLSLSFLLSILAFAAIRRSYLVFLSLWIGSIICWSALSVYCFAFNDLDMPYFLPVIELSVFSIITLNVSLNWEKIHNLQNALSLEKMNLSRKEARIEYLTKQMNTHSVFNEFSRIRGMISADPEKAKNYLVSFSNMLRYSLLYGDKPLTPLDKHLEFIKYYLSQQEIIDDRFRFYLSIKNSDLNIQLPWNTLFTLVENAVKYSEALDSAKYQTIDITISITASANEIVFIIQNPYDENTSVESTQVGVKNLRERLTYFYRDKPFSLQFTKGDTIWVSQLSLPL